MRVVSRCTGTGVHPYLHYCSSVVTVVFVSLRTLNLTQQSGLACFVWTMIYFIVKYHDVLQLRHVSPHKYLEAKRPAGRCFISASNVSKRSLVHQRRTLESNQMLACNVYTRLPTAVSYTHLRAHETPEHLVCRLLLEKKK